MSNTHFGFRNVAEKEKASLVKGVFDSVASRYDLMNDLMSAGIHRLWKNEMVTALSPKQGMKILDVAGGTGDIAFRLADRSDSHITICDINQPMLDEGRARAIDRNLLHRFEWICANAECLPFADYSFDAYTIAFGIRNVTHIDKALSEAHRVLKPGGRFLCLEFSHIPNRPLQKLYDLYSFHVIPAIGGKVTGNEEAYRYLVESIRKFPKQSEFLSMMKHAGFASAYHRNLSGGIVAIHSGRRI